MHGSLTIAKGVVYVGRCARSAWVQTYDLDGHPLAGGFTFRDEQVGRSSAAGLAVDEDHRVWVADAAAGRVRAFTLFGRPVVDVADEASGNEAEGNEAEGDEAKGNEAEGDEAKGNEAKWNEDRRGSLGRPVDVAVTGCDDELLVAVASGGRRRHALQLFHPHSGRVQSLRPDSGPRGFFHDLRGMAWGGERLYACETGAVRVYQDGALHWSVSPQVAGQGIFRPSAVAVLGDGRLVVACDDIDASAVLLCEPGGRVIRVLAEGGPGVGQVEEPLDVEVDEGAEGGPRVVVIDRAGQRVQVFTLEGRCYGTFPQLTGS